MKNLFVAAALSLLTQAPMAQGAILPWVSEDANSDGVWNYSVTNWNFQGANEWGNIPVSPVAYEGRNSLYFKYLNQDLVDGGSYTQAFGFALIPTSYAGNGTEPTSYPEYEAGKDLRAYEALEFYIKGSAGANQSAFSVWLRSPNGHGSVQVPLKAYVALDGTWKKVRIPLRSFLPAVQNTDYFQLFNVHAVGFYVNQSYGNVPFDFYVDSIKFVTGGGASMPDIRYWWKDDANQNGEYNYSTTSMANGSSLQVANQWGDVPTGYILTGPLGSTRIPSVNLHFQHNGYGYAEANLTTAVANSGFEPTSFEDRDAGKVIEASRATLNFSAPGLADGLRLKLVDQYGRSSKSVDIKNYRSSYGRYSFAYAIPTQVFAGNGFDYKAVKSVSFYVDGSVPAGEYNLSLSNLHFKRN